VELRTPRPFQIIGGFFHIGQALRAAIKGRIYSTIQPDNVCLPLSQFSAI
jgi:hypothetical protein